MILNNTIKHAELHDFDYFRQTIGNINISMHEYNICKKENKVNDLSEFISNLSVFLNLEENHFTGRMFRDD